MKNEQSVLHVSKNGIEQKPMIENSVVTTKNYADFKRITGNRMLNYSHLNKLKESMKQQDLMIPIIVNEKLEVVDGQHRLQARKELQLPVYYVMIKGLSISDTQKANANNKNWDSNDFLNFYVEQNYYHYKEFKKFKERFKFGMWETFCLLGSAKFDLRNFRNGEFVITDMPKAVSVAEKIYQIQPFYKGIKRRGFVLAIWNCLKHPDFVFDEFVQKIEYQSSKMVDCTTVDQYLAIIEEIYNYKRQSEGRIRFR